MPYWLPTCAVYIYVRARKINIMTLILSRVGFYRTGSNESSPPSVLFVAFCVVYIIFSQSKESDRFHRIRIC